MKRNMNQIKPFNIDIPRNLHRRMKLVCKKMNQHMKYVGRDLIEDFVTQMEYEFSPKHFYKPCDF